MPQLTNIELEQLNLTLGGALLLLCALYLFCVEYRDAIARLEFRLGLISLHPKLREEPARDEREVQAPVEAAAPLEWPTKWPAVDERPALSAAEVVRTARIEFVQSFAFRTKNPMPQGGYARAD